MSAAREEFQHERERLQGVGEKRLQGLQAAPVPEPGLTWPNHINHICRHKCKLMITPPREPAYTHTYTYTTYPYPYNYTYPYTYNYTYTYT